MKKNVFLNFKVESRTHFKNRGVFRKAIRVGIFKNIKWKIKTLIKSLSIIMINHP